MSLTTIRARPQTRDRLKAVARDREMSMPDLLDDLVQRAEDDAMLADSGARFAELRESGEISDYESAAELWDTAVAGDGLESE